MRFLLDTNIVSFALRGRQQVVERLTAYRPSELGVSSITVAELRYGASWRGSRKLHDLISTFCRSVTEVPFDSAAAACYGSLAADLRQRGKPIGIADTLIGAHALALGVVLVTQNTRHFNRISELAVEDWTESEG